VHLNGKMMQEFTLLLLKSESPALALFGDRPRGREDLSSFLTRPIVTDASFHQGLDLLQALKLNGSSLNDGIRIQPSLLFAFVARSPCLLAAIVW
jgi:hypothetical protein